MCEDREKGKVLKYNVNTNGLIAKVRLNISMQHEGEREAVWEERLFLSGVQDTETREKKLSVFHYNLMMIFVNSDCILYSAQDLGLVCDREIYPVNKRLKN